MPESGSTSQGVEFRVGRDRYALPLEVATKVIPLDRNDVQKGRVTYDGQDLPVLKAMEALGMQADGEQHEARGILLAMGSQTLVLAVDEVYGVRSFERTALEQAPSYFSERTASIVDGLILEGDRMIVLLDPDRLISSAELAFGSDS